MENADLDKAGFDDLKLDELTKYKPRPKKEKKNKVFFKFIGY